MVTKPLHFFTYITTPKFETMSKTDSKQVSRFNFLYRIAGYLAILLMFIVFFVDRCLHILLPHREHPQFTTWAKDMSNVKYAFSRLFIFSIPIIIYRIFF